MDFGYHFNSLEISFKMRDFIIGKFDRNLLDRKVLEEQLAFAINLRLCERFLFDESLLNLLFVDNFLIVHIFCIGEVFNL